jgi:hypothetical protein
MSLERIITRNIPAFLMTWSLGLWNSTGNALCDWQEAAKLLERFSSSKRSQGKTAGKDRNLQHDIYASWHTPRQTGLQFSIPWSRDISTLAEVGGWSTFALHFLFMFNCISFALLLLPVCYYYLSLVIHHLSNCFVFTFICFAHPSVSLLFVLSHPIIGYSTTWCYSIFCSDAGNIFQVFQSS